jgi:hypothetical protein
VGMNDERILGSLHTVVQRDEESAYHLSSPSEPSRTHNAASPSPETKIAAGERTAMRDKITIVP